MTEVSGFSSHCQWERSKVLKENNVFNHRYELFKVLLISK